ncbi:SMAD/FHA domain-containing protein [Gymnopilus junonius]|uniref:SMAD/FHA domain-containing protein n=1 Tax=Gymnopilus junonius TaxID=109634 RepID=A0A9P5TSA3_GYMJU|nr:SMAD/FHA domain-containing protein [Gymnopilus junonius]
MSRRSRSPGRRFDDGDDRYAMRNGGHDSSRRHGKLREDDMGHKRSYEYERTSSTGGRDRRHRRDEGRAEGNFKDYDERKRERERERDRQRYEGGRDRDVDPSSSRAGRRSASPRTRNLRPRDRGSHSASPAVQSPSDKAKPNFAPSGLLAAETNTVKAVDGTSTVLKYNEPPEARKPVLGWRLYVFKDAEQVELLHIHRQSAYLVGRDRLVADIALDHPSCSKQHAVFQYRYVQEKDEFGISKGVVKPFIIDLESTNGTLVNDETIPAARYYELKAGDVIKFGLSTREYVLLHDDAS